MLRAANALGIPRSTLKTWVERGFAETLNGPMRRRATDVCDAQPRAMLEPSAYAYLFGQYLGDGTIDKGPRDVYKLRIFCCSQCGSSSERWSSSVCVGPRPIAGTSRSRRRDVDYLDTFIGPKR